MMARLDLQQVFRFLEGGRSVVESIGLVNLTDEEGNLVGFTAGLFQQRLKPAAAAFFGDPLDDLDHLLEVAARVRLRATSSSDSRSFSVSAFCLSDFRSWDAPASARVRSPGGDEVGEDAGFSFEAAFRGRALQDARYLVGRRLEGPKSAPPDSSPSSSGTPPRCGHRGQAAAGWEATAPW